MLTNPRFALPLMLVVSLLLVAWGFAPAPLFFAALAGGIASWTLVEYAIHRWAFHDTRHRLTRWIWIHAHRDHHRLQKLADPGHYVLHPAASGLVLASLTAALVAALGRWGIAAGGGFGLGYVVYEGTHWVHHTPALAALFARSATFRQMHAVHEHHHRQRPDVNFGFTTFLWDRLLGTASDA